MLAGWEAAVKETVGTNLEGEHWGEAEVGVVRELVLTTVRLEVPGSVSTLLSKLAFLKLLVSRQHHRIVAPTRKRWQRRSSDFPRVFSGSYERLSIAH